MNEKKKIVLELLDADGQAVEQETPDGMKPVRIEGDFSATPSPELRPGSELGAMLAVNLPPLLLTPGASFVWQLSISGKTRDEWRAVFYTRACKLKDVCGPTAARPPSRRTVGCSKGPW
jgi:hypothetical protein